MRFRAFAPPPRRPQLIYTPLVRPASGLLQVGDECLHSGSIQVNDEVVKVDNVEFKSRDDMR